MIHPVKLTGTVTVTNGSKTITGSGAAFTALMAGRKFGAESQQTWYDIASFTSSDVVVLEQAYQGDDDSGITYTIYQDEYRLDADSHHLHRQMLDLSGWFTTLDLRGLPLTHR